MENHGFMRKIDSLWGMRPDGRWFFHNIHIIHRMSSGKKALFSFSSGYDILSANISPDRKRENAARSGENEYELEGPLEHRGLPWWQMRL